MTERADEDTIRYWSERAEACFAAAAEIDRAKRTSRGPRAVYGTVSRAYSLAGGSWRKAADRAADSDFADEEIDGYARDGATFEARAHRLRHDLDGPPIPEDPAPYPER
jgi:hypothetical protein